MVLPANLAASGADTDAIDLTWNRYSPDVDDYVVQWSPDGTENSWQTVPGPNNPVAADLDDTQQEFIATDTTMTEGTTRYYRVMAEGTNGNSPYTDAVSAATLLNTPSDMTATAPNGHEVDVTWSDNSLLETGYSIQEDLGDGDWEEVGWLDTEPNESGSTLSIAVDGDFEPAMAYNFRVIAYSDDNQSLPSEAATVTSDAWPEAPTDLTAAQGESDDQVDLAWTAPAGTVEYYAVEASGGSYGGWTQVDTVYPSQGSSVEDTVTVVAGGNSYSFRVMAKNAVGTSPYSNVPDPVDTPNAAPAINYCTIQDSPVTDVGSCLSSAATDDGGSNVMYHWEVTSTPSGGDAWFASNDSPDASGPYVTFTMAGDYEFSLTVTDSQGASTTSDPLDVTVSQTLTSIVLTPDVAAVLPGYTRQFAADGLDQFDYDMTTQPTFTWSADAGAIDEYGVFSPPGDGTTACTVSASAASGSNTITGTAAAVVQQWTVDGQPDPIDFEGEGYGGNGTSTVTYAAAGVTFATASPAFLTIGPLRTDDPEPSGPNILYGGTSYNCAHQCTSSDGAADMTISFASPTGVDYFTVVGRLVSSVCPARGDGVFSAGSMTVHMAGGEVLTTDLRVTGTVVAGTNNCDNVGPHNSVDLYGSVSLWQFGPVTEIDLDVNRIPFVDGVTNSGGDGPGGTAWCHHWIGEQELGIGSLQLATLWAPRST